MKKNHLNILIKNKNNEIIILTSNKEIFVERKYNNVKNKKYNKQKIRIRIIE